MQIFSCNNLSITNSSSIFKRYIFLGNFFVSMLIVKSVVGVGKAKNLQAKL